jgi:aspartyl-tRNA(Asn)/glutamyl-tRNA(Gln) amidotransferase subunit B
MRSKEDAQDYRYFPDPDLPPLVIAQSWIDDVQAAMPELPQAMQARLVAAHGLPAESAAQLVSSRATAEYFEHTVAAGVDARLASNWMVGEMSAALNRAGIEITDAPVGWEQFARLQQRIADGTISGKIAKDVFDAMWNGESGGDPDAIIAARGLRQISDEGAIAAIVDAVIGANPAIVAEYRAGKEKAFQSLVGQAMKASKGKANPAQVNAMLKSRLAG